jgi:hypothetical protein
MMDARMNEQDKAAARQALERKQLTIEQVEAIRAEVDRSGRPFKEVAKSRGLLVEPTPAASAWKAFLRNMRLSPLYLGLLIASFFIFAGLLIASLFKLEERSRRDEELMLETARSNAEADRKGGEARRGYTQSLIQGKEAQAREHLGRARAAMARVDSILNTGTLPPELTLLLNDAYVGYNAYLAVLPDDAVVLVERAKTHEMRRNYDLAIADLERAIQLKPEMEVPMKSRIAQLKLLVARKPQ